MKQPHNEHGWEKDPTAEEELLRLSKIIVRNRVADLKDALLSVSPHLPQRGRLLKAISELEDVIKSF